LNSENIYVISLKLQIEHRNSADDWFVLANFFSFETSIL